MKKSILSAVVVAVALSSWAIPTSAHFTEPVDPAWESWAMRQFNVTGGRCCDGSDAYVYAGAWHYDYEGDRLIGATLETLDGGKPVFVPWSRFVDRARDPSDLNPTGASVVWFYQLDNAFCWDPPGALG